MGIPCRALLAVGAFIWLAGCAVGPDYSPPTVAIPTEFGTALLTPAVASALATADLVRWWQVLGDPQLNALIERAVVSSPDIEIMLTRVQEVRSQEIVALGAMLPTVGGSGTVATGSGTDLTRGRVAPSIRAGGVTSDVRSISRMGGLDAVWELDLFGKYRRSLEAAHDDVETQAELRSAALIDVIGEIAREYFEIRGRQIQREIVRRNVATAQRTIGLLKTRSSGREESKSSEASGRGQSNELDINLAQRELATQEARLPELETAISAAESRLALLLGTYSAEIAEAMKSPAKMPHLPERLRPGVPVDLLRRRPDIRAAERELAAATARIGVATADLFPSVSLTAGYGAQHASRQGTTPIPLHGPIWSVGPAAYWPLLDFGRLDALINIEDMRAHETLVKYRKTIIAAVEEVDQAMKQYRSDLQRLKALGVALDASHRAVDLTTEHYERGETDFRVVLDVQRRHYELMEDRAIAEAAVVLRYVAFYKALGGGWELYNELPPIPSAEPAIIASVRRLADGWH
jgi:NodT family efflux transporter outer membrane factor (OMF) lipoprotein